MEAQYAMKRKIECIIYILSLFLISILGLLTFFGAPHRLLLYPAYTLAVLVVAKLLIEIVLHDFHIKRDPEERKKITDELVRLEADVKDYNPHILMVLMLWLAIIVARNYDIQVLHEFIKLAEKFVAAILVVVSIFVVFALVDFVHSRGGKIPGVSSLKKQNDTPAGE